MGFWGPILESRPRDRPPNAALDEILVVMTGRSARVVDRPASYTSAVTHGVGLHGLLLFRPAKSARLALGVGHQEMLVPIVEFVERIVVFMVTGALLQHYDLEPGRGQFLGDDSPGL